MSRIQNAIDQIQFWRDNFQAEFEIHANIVGESVQAREASEAREICRDAIIALRYMQKEFTDASKKSLRQYTEDDLFIGAEDFLNGVWREQKKDE